MRPEVCFSHVWNDRDGRFESCFVPVIVFAPTIITIILLLAQLLLPFIRRPSWLRPFVGEYHPRDHGGDAIPRRQGRFATILTVLASACLVLQLPSMMRAGDAAIQSALPALPWLVAASMLVVYRPQMTPFGVLTIFLLQGIVDVIRLVDAYTAPRTSDDRPFIIAALTLTFIGIMIMLFMPLRDPSLPADDISRPGSEPTSRLRSPEDNLTLWQFMTVSWMGPLISVGYKRQLEDEDVWQLPHEFHHKNLHDNFRELKGTVVQRLLEANGIDLLILTTFGLLELVLQFSSPLLLQKILAGMEGGASYRSGVLTYVILVFIVQVIGAQSGVFSLWYGRRCYERSRGELITMLYEKTLNRKAGFPQDSKGIDELGNGHANGETNQKQQQSWRQRSLARISTAFKREQKAPPRKEPASMGKILNLQRNDAYEVAQRFWEFQDLIKKPLSLVISIVLVVRFLGWPSMLAVLSTTIAQGLNVILARVMIHFEKKRRLATDQKLLVTSQWIEAIRHLRWYGWQHAWLSHIMDARQRELKLRVITSIWNVAISFCNLLSMETFPVIAFFAYTVIAGKDLTVDIAFPALQLFNMLTASLRDLPNLIIVLTNAYIAVGRIEDYMAEPDMVDQSFEGDKKDTITFHQAAIAWPRSNEPVLRLQDHVFSEGLTVICGEVGTGKTALLESILGELELLHGDFYRPNEAIAYCAQTPWLQSMNIRENILFGEPWDERRYMQVLDSCALQPDLKDFQAGDLSHIGENGIGLSGGQKARVALARAAYSRANIVLLDDPFASLDSDTAMRVCSAMFGAEDSLLVGRTVVLATHQPELVSDFNAQRYRLKAGTLTRDNINAPDVSLHHRVDTNEREGQTVHRDTDIVPEKFIEEEHRQKGGVKASVYWEYVKAGNLTFWGMLIPVLAVTRLSIVASSWFLKTWGEAYERQPRLGIWLYNQEVISTTSNPLDGLPSPNVNVRPWLLIYLGFGVFETLTFVLSQSIMIIIIYTAGKNMFAAIMDKVAGATFRFYDVTPVGRLMNRMTSDVSVIDGNISNQFQTVAWLVVAWVSSIVVIGSVTPVFLAFAILLTIAFILIFSRFIRTSQSLRRLEMVSLTPLMSNFGALLNGLTTVRAFKVQKQFQDRVIRVVDTFQKMDHFYWSLQAWLMYRYDMLAALSTLVLTLLAIYTDVSAGLTAFVLLAATKLVSATHALCRTYGQLQMQFVSVERIVELLHLDQEDKGTVQPPAWWPRPEGDIVLQDVTVRYSPKSSPALNGLSVRIPGGKKTVVVGRTGSGKTTLALSLLATVTPESGSITIDGYDLARIDRHILRRKVTFLAQDAVLFPGSIRQNLDPLEDYSDDECETVLNRVCEKQNFRLDTRVEGGGRNVSQGQRQLIGLARAVLRNSPIIILDEATASIDTETAIQIQQVLQQDLKHSTIITIAHRPEAMQLSEWAIVLADGRLQVSAPAQDVTLEG